MRVAHAVVVVAAAAHPIVLPPIPFARACSSWPHPPHLPCTHQADLRFVLTKCPLLLDEMIKIAILPRPPSGYGWLVSGAGAAAAAGAWGSGAPARPLQYTSPATPHLAATPSAPPPPHARTRAFLPSPAYVGLAGRPAWPQTPAIAVVEMMQCPTQPQTPTAPPPRPHAMARRRPPLRSWR